MIDTNETMDKVSRMTDTVEDIYIAIGNPDLTDNLEKLNDLI